MQEIHPDILPYQESFNSPVIRWKVILRTPLPSDTDEISYQETNISERLMSEPVIVDTTDYRENLTFVNEIALKLNNEDGTLSNDQGTGIIDVSTKTELYIEGYYDVPGGIDHAIRKFGGWLSKDRTKLNAVSKTIEAVFYSYLGLGDYRSGKRICKRYFSDNGLVLFNIGTTYLTNAAISGKALKKGIHHIESKLDGSDAQLKLDDGEYTTVTPGLNVLSNADDSQRVEVNYDISLFNEDSETALIVKAEGEQYPYTFYFNTNLKSVGDKIFKELEIANYQIENYEFETHDSREVESFYEAPDELMNPVFEFVNCIVGDGASYTYLGYKNEIWRRDMNTGAYDLIAYGLAGYVNRLVIDVSLNKLFAIAVDDAKWEIKKIYKVDLDSLNSSVIFSNPDVANDIKTTAFFQIALVYSYTNHFFILACKLNSNPANKKIVTIDYNGNINTVVSDNSIYPDGFNCVWQDGANTRYFIVRSGSYGAYTLSRLTYSGSWGSMNDREAWYLGSDNIDTYGIVNETEGRVLVNHYVNNSPYFTYNFNTNTFNTSFYEAFTKLLSGIEYKGVIYTIKYYEGSGKFYVATLSNDVLTVNESELKVFRRLRQGYQTQLFAINKNYQGVDILNIQTNEYNLLVRFSNWVVPGILGEVDSSDLTIRELLQELAMSFLGYVKINSSKYGYFVSRSGYDSGESLQLNPDFIKERISEKAYSEKYDRVELSVGDTKAEYGDTDIEASSLSLSLRYLDSRLAKDLAKFLYDYYNVSRSLITIKYPPTFYNVESLDQADLVKFDLGVGKFHKVTPRKSECEFEILVDN